MSPFFNDNVPQYKPRKSLTPEHRLAISIALKKIGLKPPSPKGKKWTMERRKKASEYHKANPTLGMKGKHHSNETIEKIRKSNLGKKRSADVRKKLSLLSIKSGKKPPSRKGVKESLKTRKKKSKLFKGENNPNWMGGLTHINNKIRGGLEYRLWREAVFKRDNYTCVHCKKRGCKLEADHIKPFSIYPELRFAIDNGRTLCKECHKETDTWGYKLILYKNQNATIQ